MANDAECNTGDLVTALSAAPVQTIDAAVQGEQMALVAAAEPGEAVDRLQNEIAIADAVTERKNASAPPGNPARPIQLQNASEAFGVAMAAIHRGGDTSAIKMLRSLGQDHPWALTIAEQNPPRVIKEIELMQDGKQSFEGSVHLHSGRMVERLLELSAATPAKAKQ